MLNSKKIKTVLIITFLSVLVIILGFIYLKNSNMAVDGLNDKNLPIVSSSTDIFSLFNVDENFTKAGVVSGYVLVDPSVNTFATSSNTRVRFIFNTNPEITKIGDWVIYNLSFFIDDGKLNEVEVRDEKTGFLPAGSILVKNSKTGEIKINQNNFGIGKLLVGGFVVKSRGDILSIGASCWEFCLVEIYDSYFSLIKEGMYGYSSEDPWQDVETGNWYFTNNLSFDDGYCGISKKNKIGISFEYKASYEDFNNWPEKVPESMVFGCKEHYENQNKNTEKESLKDYIKENVKKIEALIK